MADNTKETIPEETIPQKRKLSLKGVLSFAGIFLLGCAFTAVLGAGGWALNKYIINPTSNGDDECPECEECEECDGDDCPICEECSEIEDRTDTLSISYLDERLYITYPYAYESDINYEWADYGGGEGSFELDIDGATLSIGWFDPMGWESFSFPDLSIVDFSEIEHKSGDSFIRVSTSPDYEGDHEYTYTVMYEADDCRDIFSESSEDFTGRQCGMGVFSGVGDVTGLLFVGLTIPEGYSESDIEDILDIADDIVANLDME